MADGPNVFITRLLTTGWIKKFTFRKTGMMHKYVYTEKGEGKLPKLDV